jgi:hypothetical protein
VTDFAEVVDVHKCLCAWQGRMGRERGGVKDAKVMMRYVED